MLTINRIRRPRTTRVQSAPTDRRTTGGDITVNTGGTCSTEREFKQVLIKDKTYLAKAYEDIKVVFHTFDVKGPMKYQNLQDRYSTVTDKAYRVTTSYDVIIKGDAMGTNKIYRNKYENSVYMFYTAQWSDGLNCIHFAEKNPFAIVEHEEITEEDY